MAFWGVEVKPGKPHIHQYDNEIGRLHLSQATLGSGSSTKKSIVQCNVGDKKPIYLCSLLPERLETCQLNLEFEEHEEVTFSVIGPHSVHLSGFFYRESQDNFGDDYGSDSGEDIVDSEGETDDSTDYDTEDEYEDDFIVDDLEYSLSPIPKSGVKIEEILDDEKPVKENVISKLPKKKNNQLSRSDEDDASQQQIVVKSNSGFPVLESEDEDGFLISSPGKSKADNRKIKSKAGIENKVVSKEARQKKAMDGSDHIISLKRKIDATAQDGEQVRETGQLSNSSFPTTEMVPENDVRQKKKNKRTKVNAKDEKVDGASTESMGDIQPEGKTTGDSNGATLVGKNIEKLINEEKYDVISDSGADENRSKKTKKNKKKRKKKDGAPDANIDQAVTQNSGFNTETEKSEAKPFQVRTFPNGLIIEELKIGKPDGKRASPGKKVSVHYIGKLKKNSKIFDSNVGRAPFKFRLGVGQVIKGWDVGVNGMRIGDKRRLTIPPAMGYGAEGAGGAIPPNSWLVFDVELVDVN